MLRKRATREFIGIAIWAAGIVILGCLVTVHILARAVGPDSFAQEAFVPILVEFALLILIIIVGILIAWIRMLKDRGERRTRSPFLDLE